MSFRLKHKKSSSETFGLKNPLLSTLKRPRPSLEPLKDRKLSTGGKADIEVVVGIGNAIGVLIEFCIVIDYSILIHICVFHS